MKDRLGAILYVGKAKDLKKRVSSYFQPSRKFKIEQPKIAAMIPLIKNVETITVKNESEAILLEGRLIKQWKPRYNTDFVDDKRFLLVRVGMRDEIPSFTLVRNRLDDGALYFGPFAHAGLLRRTLAEMRLKFGVVLGDTHPLRLDDGRYKLYDDMRADIYGHTNEVTREEYRQRVEAACQFFEGKTREWVAEMEERMKVAAEKRDYEKAAELRDLLKALRETARPTRKFTRQGPDVSAVEKGPLRMLQGELDLPNLPRAIECFDISHISGTFVVASMVRFYEGRPDRKQYRRYRIKSFVGNDDFRAMEEVVGRRYSRLKEEGSPFPDLVVIDGGKGQVHAALKAFLVHELEVPPLIGLAKREERVVFPGEREDVRMKYDNPALHVLQRIRDEAHRFANTYNAELRSRKLRESVLDGLSGLGQKRKEALFAHFKTLENLRKASVAEIRAVEGIGPGFAQKVYNFLNGDDAPRE